MLIVQEYCGPVKVNFGQLTRIIQECRRTAVWCFHRYSLSGYCPGTGTMDRAYRHFMPVSEFWYSALCIPGQGVQSAVSYACENCKYCSKQFPDIVEHDNDHQTHQDHKACEIDISLDIFTQLFPPHPLQKQQKDPAAVKGRKRDQIHDSQIG